MIHPTLPKWIVGYAPPAYSCENTDIATLPARPLRGTVPWPGVARDNAVLRSFAMAAADRHLLFGLLALQNGIINQGQLVAAFQAWSLDKSRSLAEHLEVRGDLSSAKRAVLDALAAVHVETHGGDVEQSLAAVPSSRSTCASLAELREPDIEGTLARIIRGKNGQATAARR